jgi:hypothetical protein
MAKKSQKKVTRPLRDAPKEQNISITKQAVGGVSGAVLGAMVGGPVGAIAGGVAGTIVGEQSARGKRPVARTAETVSDEIRKGTPQKAVKSVVRATTSLIPSKKKSAKSSTASTTKSGGRKKAKSSSHSKTISAVKRAKTATRAKKGGAKKTR